nr:glycine zipper family protein [Gordonia sp. 'Campus']
MTLTVHNASLSTAGGNLTVRDTSGAELFRMPLSYGKEYRQFPIDARTAGNKVTLIPSRDLSRSSALDPVQVNQLRDVARHNVAGPQTRQQRDDEALERFNTQLRTGMTISSLVGTVVGGIVGGVIGCVGGLAFIGIGCPIAIPFGTAAGALAGLALGGGGTLIGAGIQYFQTINSPFVPPRR